MAVNILKKSVPFYPPIVPIKRLFKLLLFCSDEYFPLTAPDPHQLNNIYITCLNSTTSCDRFENDGYNDD